MTTLSQKKSPSLSPSSVPVSVSANNTNNNNVVVPQEVASTSLPPTNVVNLIKKSNSSSSLMSSPGSSNSTLNDYIQAQILQLKQEQEIQEQILLQRYQAQRQQLFYEHEKQLQMRLKEFYEQQQIQMLQQQQQQQKEENEEQMEEETTKGDEEEKDGAEGSKGMASIEVKQQLKGFLLNKQQLKHQQLLMLQQSDIPNNFSQQNQHKMYYAQQGGAPVFVNSEDFPLRKTASEPNLLKMKLKQRVLERRSSPLVLRRKQQSSAASQQTINTNKRRSYLTMDERVNNQMISCGSTPDSDGGGGPSNSPPIIISSPLVNSQQKILLLKGGSPSLPNISLGRPIPAPSTSSSAIPPAVTTIANDKLSSVSETGFPTIGSKLPPHFHPPYYYHGTAPIFYSGSPPIEEHVYPNNNPNLIAVTSFNGGSSSTSSLSSATSSPPITTTAQTNVENSIQIITQPVGRVIHRPLGRTQSAPLPLGHPMLMLNSTHPPPPTSALYQSHDQQQTNTAHHLLRQHIRQTVLTRAGSRGQVISGLNINRTISVDEDSEEEKEGGGGGDEEGEEDEEKRRLRRNRKMKCISEGAGGSQQQQQQQQMAQQEHIPDLNGAGAAATRGVPPGVLLHKVYPPVYPPYNSVGQQYNFFPPSALPPQFPPASSQVSHFHPAPISALQQHNHHVARPLSRALSSPLVSLLGPGPSSPNQQDQVSVIASNNTSPSATGLAFDSLMLKHQCLCGDNSQHPEHPGRLQSIWARLQEKGLTTVCERIRARKATLEEIQSCHTETYTFLFGTNPLSRQRFELNRFPEASLPIKSLVRLPCNGIGVDSDTAWNELHTPSAARMAAGCVVDLSLKVASGELKNGFAVVRPPGHHAEMNTAMGFCFFNSIAIAAKQIRSKLQMEKILLVDWDVHHGNGTQSIFYDDPHILYLSVHRHDGGNFFPGTGEFNECGVEDGVGFTVNVPWSGGLNPPMGDAEYLAAFRTIVMPIAQDFQPDIILVSCGFDAAIGHPPPLGGYNVSPACFGWMTRQLMGVTPHGKMVLALEGGYDLPSICDSAEECVKALLGEKGTPISEEELVRQPNQSAVETLMKTISFQTPHWPCIKRFKHLAACSHLEANARELKAPSKENLFKGKSESAEINSAMALLSVQQQGSATGGRGGSQNEEEPMEEDFDLGKSTSNDSNDNDEQK